MIRRMAAAAAAGTLVALAIAGTAQADDSETPTIEITPGEKCGAEITYTNATNWHFWGDWRLADDEGQPDSAFPALPADAADYGDGHDHGVTPELELADLPGETFGLQYNPLLLAPGESRTVAVEVDEATTVDARIWRGAEQKLYVPWTEPVAVEPCPVESTPTPEPTPSVTAEPTPEASEAPGAGGELPATSGTTAPAIGAVGALLLAFGGVAVWAARRRLAPLD